MGWPEWGRWAAGTGRWLRANATTLASSSSIDGSASSSGSSRSTAEVVDVRLVPGVPSSAARANERERRTPLIADAGVFASVSAARHAGLRRRCSRRSPGCVRAAGIGRAFTPDRGAREAVPWSCRRYSAYYGLRSRVETLLRSIASNAEQ